MYGSAIPLNRVDTDVGERQRGRVGAAVTVMESVSPQQSTPQVHYQLERDRWACWTGERRRCCFKCTNEAKHHGWCRGAFCFRAGSEEFSRSGFSSSCVLF